MQEDFREILGEIRLLHKKYHNTIEGRKEIIKEIREKINQVRKITSFCNPELDELERYYSYRDYYISDYELVMSLLLRLANFEEEIYAMREVTATGYYNTGTSNSRLYSKILFITEKNSIDKFNNFYLGDEFAKSVTKYINKGHSMILITTNLFENNVKPKTSELMCDKIFDIRNGGLKGNITCYVNSLSLQKALYKFIKYVEKNGPDFSGISEDTLFELMTKENTKTKKK